MKSLKPLCVRTVGVVAQTRPMEGCDSALARRLRRRRDVLTEDGAMAVDTEQVSAASDAVVSRGTHTKFRIHLNNYA